MTSRSAAKILIRADASASIGVGHVMRCLTLFATLRSLGIEGCFAYQQMPAALEQQVAEQGGQLFRWQPSDLATDARQTLALAAEIGAAALLVDGYRFDSAYHRQLADSGLPLIVMDDLNDRGPLYASLLINSLPHADQLGYQETAPQAVQLLGLRYVLLREEFSQLPPQLPASERPRLLVNFGGSDILGLSLPVTKGLLEKDPQLPISLITGSGFAEPAAATALARQYPRVEHLHNCQQMATQFCRAGLALAAPGATVYELAACGVPSVFLTCADNQELSAAAHQAYGWCRVFDARRQNGLASALTHTLQLWKSPRQRDALQSKTAGLVSGGAERVATKILQLMARP